MSLSRVILLYFLGLQPRDKAAMLMVYNRIFARRIYLKIEERNAFVLDHQHGRRDVTCKPAIRGTNSFKLLLPCVAGVERGGKRDSGQELGLGYAIRTCVPDEKI